MTDTAGSAAPQPNPDTAIEFLKWHSAAGPWTLTAIPPDGGATDTCQFDPETEHDCRAWLQRHHDAQNGLYFMVNPPIGVLKKKAMKEHVKEMAYLHIDLDAKGDGDQTANLAAILDKLQRFYPPPSAVIFSGGGYQGFWKIDQPVFVGGNVDKCVELEAYNIQLSVLLGGDHCHNLDRIMRLPGTVNYPNQTKQKRGRVPTLATLVGDVTDRDWGLQEFKAAPRTQDSSGASAAANVKLPADLPTITDLDQLGPSVKDWVRALIVQGHDPTNPNAHGSRSEAVWAVICGLLRADVPDEMIAAVLLDKGFGISAHIYAQKRPVPYVARQIGRAKEDVVDHFDRAAADKPPSKESPRNIRLAVRKLGGVLRFDQFAQQELVTGLPDLGPRLDDTALNWLRLRTKERFGFLPTREFFVDCLRDAARTNEFHPVKDHLLGLRHDDKARLNTWLTEYAGAPNTPFVSQVGRIMLVAAVQRVMEPGCKFDEIPVFESAQGTNKSSALRILAGRDEWFSDDLPLDGDPRRLIEALEAKWIVEASELSGLKRANIEQLKAMLSRTVDRGRRAYDRFVTELPRQSLFVGTTNSRSFLRDLTGNRRFWPVTIVEFNLEKLKRDRDQLFAEAVIAYSAGESIRLPRDLWKAAGAEQEERLLHDPYYLELISVLGTDEGRVRPAYLWERLGIPMHMRTQAMVERLGGVMQRLGFEYKKARFGGENPEWGYVRGSSTKQFLADFFERLPPDKLADARNRGHTKSDHSDAPF